jgi:uncharacterized protein with HEPN domain
MRVPQIFLFSIIASLSTSVAQADTCSFWDLFCRWNQQLKEAQDAPRVDKQSPPPAGVPPSVTQKALDDMAPQPSVRDRVNNFFAADLDEKTFHSDLRSLYAVVRCLEIISEASRRLPDDLKARYPSIPWKRMAGAGNIYRHSYEDVAARYVWETVQRDLPQLRAVIMQELN